MILVTLGTQDKSFKRLLDAVEKQIDNGNIKERVVVQAGLTKYQSDKMEIFDFIPVSKFDDLIKSCDVLITHAGVGSIVAGLKNKKVVIAAARLKKYHEHTNDHQLQIVDNFTKSGYILPLNNFDELDKVLQKAKKFKPKAYQSNTENFIKLIKDYIDNN